MIQSYSKQCVKCEKLLKNLSESLEITPCNPFYKEDYEEHIFLCSPCYKQFIKWKESNDSAV